MQNVVIFNTKCVSKARKVTSENGCPRLVNNVSYVSRINHESHFAWQAHYLVTLEGESCCSAHCKRPFICEKINRESHFAWHAQYLVRLEGESCCSAHCK